MSSYSIIANLTDGRQLTATDYTKIVRARDLVAERVAQYGRDLVNVIVVRSDGGVATFSRGGRPADFDSRRMVETWLVEESR